MIEWIAAIFFGFAILHTFLVRYFRHIANQFPDGSIGENFFHLLGEVEVVFGFWAALMLMAMAITNGTDSAFYYLDSRNFTEPVFVFVILVISSTQPILDMAESFIITISKLLPFNRSISFYLTVLSVGPILGSFITEPAAMTVTALLLLKHFYQKNISTPLMYATLGLLFVNVSIGGTLTPFAAPPILMVANKWNWGLKEMLLNFGWKGALACSISAFFIAFKFKSEIKAIQIIEHSAEKVSPVWVRIIHLLFLVGVVAAAHHPKLVISLFLFFMGFAEVTKEHQQTIRLKEGLLVSFFLGGLVVIGGMQTWWLAPIISKLTALPLYLGAMGLTAITDNAALTYLASLVPSLTLDSRYALVAGAVVGGGLTVIANAPNPAGYNILQPSFDKDGISALQLFKSALIPTLIAAICFWFL